MIGLLPHLSCQQVVSLLFGIPVCRWSKILTGKEGGGGAKSYDGKKVRSSINHSNSLNIQYGISLVFSILQYKAHSFVL
jgi:hypothetical protein